MLCYKLKETNFFFFFKSSKCIFNGFNTPEILMTHTRPETCFREVCKFISNSFLGVVTKTFAVSDIFRLNE